MALSISNKPEPLISPYSPFIATGSFDKPLAIPESILAVTICPTLASFDIFSCKSNSILSLSFTRPKSLIFSSIKSISACVLPILLSSSFNSIFSFSLIVLAKVLIFSTFFKYASKLLLISWRNSACLIISAVNSAICFLDAIIYYLVVFSISFFPSIKCFSCSFFCNIPI